MLLHRVVVIFCRGVKRMRKTFLNGMTISVAE